MLLYERQAQICKAFANPVRLQLLDVVSNGELPCAEIQERLGISKPNLSQHLAILKAVGILNFRRQGKQIFCSLALPEVKQACQLVRKVLLAQSKNSSRFLDV